MKPDYYNAIRDKYNMSSLTLPKEFTLSSAINAYVDTDIAATLNAYQKYKERRAKSMYAIKNVIFNNPATIVFWADGTKTVVKAQGDDAFDPEKGLAMAISKKVLGNKGNYCNELKKWLPKENIIDNDESMLQQAIDQIKKAVSDSANFTFGFKGKNLNG